jgi:hypothetical protein
MRKETTTLSRQTKDNIQLLGTSEYQNVNCSLVLKAQNPIVIC